MKNRTGSLLLALFLLLAAVSPVLAAAAEGSSPWTTSMLLWRVVNTVALVALLVWALKKPLVTFFKDRKTQIEKDLAEAKEQRDRALQLIKEYEQKIAGMQQELDKMRADLRKAAGAESEKVVANAERLSATMVETARLTAEQEVRKAKITLKNEAVDLAVQMAEALIREKINEDDRKRIVEDYLAKVGGMK
jgi:F-type H+-transporting ATPase subunit b